MAAKDEEHTKWSRADRIAVITAVAALITALAPYPPRIVHYIWQTPSAAIKNITTAMVGTGKQCKMQFMANGVADHIPANEDLWLIVRSYEGLWYPVARLKSNPWRTRGTAAITPTDLPANIDIILLSNTRDGSFIKNASQRREQGYSNLPPDNQVLSVNPLNDLSVFCGRIPGF
jgi:hypothetical protein